MIDMTAEPNSGTRPEATGPDVWYGSEMRGSECWIRHLTDGEIRELHLAVAGVEREGLDIADITRDDVPLPGLAPELARVREELLRGRGFVLMRGLPVRGRSMRQIAIAFWAIGTHLGEAISQNAKGHLLGHVKDIGHDPANPEHRLYATRARHRFHTDSCDVVGLFCVRPAKRGGLSSISSSATIHHEMRRRRPDLADVLSRPIHIDRKGEIPEGKLPYYRMPVFNHHAGCVTTYYARDFFDGAQRHEGVPPVPPEQTEAMDLFEELAARPTSGSTWSCGPATCSSCTTTRSCTRAPGTRTTPSPSAGGTCCGSGSRPRTTGASSRPPSRSATGTSPWAPSGAASWCPERSPTRPSTRRAEGRDWGGAAREKPPRAPCGGRPKPTGAIGDERPADDLPRRSSGGACAPVGSRFVRGPRRGRRSARSPSRWRQVPHHVAVAVHHHERSVQDFPAQVDRAPGSPGRRRDGDCGGGRRYASATS